MFDITIDMTLMTNILLLGYLILGMVLLFLGWYAGFDDGVVFIVMGVISVLISLGYLLTFNNIIMVHYI